MKAAIYARKSNDDSDKHEDNRSVARQIERAKAYAARKGWSVDDEHVYSDDGISGAEYQGRPGLLRMMAHLKEFDVIVVSEISRLGRDMVRNAVVIDDIRSAGVRIFYYLTDEEELAETPEQKIMVTLKSFAAEVERAKTAQRTRDALQLRVERGESAGGRCFGYDNTWVYPDGREVPAPFGVKKPEDAARTVQRVNTEQARIVCGVFKMYVEGYGHSAIAKCLNGDERYGEPLRRYFDGHTPQPPQDGTGSWAPSSVRVMLMRTRYVGRVPYGEFKNVSRGGRTGQCVKQDKFLVIERPELRIVDDALWKRVQTRLTAVREKYVRGNGGRLEGRPEAHRESRYLLSGLARCGCKNGDHICGGNIGVVGGQKRSHYYYGCTTYVNRGRTVCANDTRARMAEIDKLVVDAISETVLTPGAIDWVIEHGVREAAERLRAKPERPREIEAEAKRLRRELDRFLGLIAEGSAPAAVLTEIRRREQRLAELEAERGRYQGIEPNDLDLRRLHREGTTRIKQLHELLHGNIPRARQALRKLLRGPQGRFQPLEFVPVMRDGKKSFTIRGHVSVASLVNKVGTEERT